MHYTIEVNRYVNCIGYEHPYCGGIFWWITLLSLNPATANLFSLITRAQFIEVPPIDFLHKMKIKCIIN